jgi:DNA-binding CsgD family transcriptional regulator
VTPLDLVGRADAVRELISAWDRVPRETTHGGPQTVVITGEAGVGKSRLISAAVDAIRERDASVTVLSASARVHSPAPYDWLAGILSQAPRHDLPVPPEALAWLAQDPDVPRLRYAPDALLRIAVRTVRELVGAGPAVIVVDDLHALDPASVNLVAELAAAPGLPALLLVAGRPAADAAAPELIRLVLARLVGGAHARRVHVGPLSESEVGELLRGRDPQCPAATAAAAHRITAGNPYRLNELIATTDLAALAATVTDPTAADLTARELEVLACLASGMSNKQVARSLGISIRTVGVHVSSLLRKTRSASRTDAALWAVRSQVLADR